jgi:hypothetical protein
MSKLSFSDLEREHAQLRASLVQANRFATELAVKLATAGQIIGFTPDASVKEIAAQCRIRTGSGFLKPKS